MATRLRTNATQDSDKFWLSSAPSRQGVHVETWMHDDRWLQIDVCDYDAPAELFPSRSRAGRGQVKYKRFDTAAEALRFALEVLPPSALLGAYLEVEEGRFGAEDIRSLYESAAYPLARAAARS